MQNVCTMLPRAFLNELLRQKIKFYQIEKW
jgi:hypothetical protein